MTADDTTTNGTAEPEKVADSGQDESADGEDAPLKTTSAPPKKRGRGRPSGGGAGAAKKSAGKASKKSKKKGKGKKKAEGDEAKAGEEGAANGEAGDAEVDAEDGEGEKKKKKPVKKVIPYWATLSGAQAAAKASKMGPIGTTGIGVIIDAIKNNADGKGMASYIAIKKFVQKNNPSWPKMVFKSALRRSVQNGRVKQVRNSYKVVSEAPVKTAKVEKKVSKSRSKTTSVVKEGPLEELFPHIFTWVCEPKEASYGLIRKYIGKHFPNLSNEGPMKKAIENMVLKGQLDQITGKGASGTLQLVDGAKKTGTVYEDPVEDAIIASNEPKDASVSALRHYLSEYHTEYDVANKPKVLRKALDRAEAMGWIVRVTGKGFTGTFRLAYPYIPSPRDLWRGDYNASDYDPKKRSRTYDSSSEEEESEEESESESEAISSSDYDSDVEVIPKKRKRGAPTARGDVPKPKARKTGAGRPPKAAKKAEKKSSPKKKGRGRPKKAE